MGRCQRSQTRRNEQRVHPLGQDPVGAALPNNCWQMIQKSPKLGHKRERRLPVCQTYFIDERYVDFGSRS